MRSFSRSAVRAAIAIGVAVAMAAGTMASSGLSAEPAAADGVNLSDAPAPPDFGATLTAIFNDANTAPPPPGTQPPEVSPADFQSQVAALTPAQLTQIYDTNPTAWGPMKDTLDAYAQSQQGVSGVTANAAPASPITTSGPTGLAMTPEAKPIASKSSRAKRSRRTVSRAGL